MREDNILRVCVGFVLCGWREWNEKLGDNFRGCVYI